MTRAHPATVISASDQHDNSIIQIPSLIQVSIYKQTKNVKAGIGLRKDGLGRILVIKKSELLLSSELKIGDEVIAINEHPVTSVREAIAILKDAEGTVNITAVASENDNTTSTEDSSNKDMEAYGQFTFTRKSDYDNSFGIWFDTTRDVLVRVARISPTSPFASSILRPGDIILSVNGHVVTQAQHADHLVARAVSDDASLALFSFSVERYCESLLETYITAPSGLSATSKIDKYSIERIDQSNTKLIRKDKKYEATLSFQNSKYEIIEHGIGKGTLIEKEKAHYNRLSKKVNKMNEMLEQKIAIIENTVMSKYKPLDTGAKFVSNLLQLGEMKKEGLLSENEFEAAKSKLLDLQPTYELPVIQAIASAY